MVFVQLRVCWSASRYSKAVSVTPRGICEWSIRPTRATTSTDTRSDSRGPHSRYFCSLASPFLSTREKKRTQQRTRWSYWDVCNLIALTKAVNITVRLTNQESFAVTEIFLRGGGDCKCVQRCFVFFLGQNSSNIYA